jgi:hypothetical protein
VFDGDTISGVRYAEPAAEIVAQANAAREKGIPQRRSV